MILGIESENLIKLLYEYQTNNDFWSKVYLFLSLFIMLLIFIFILYLFHLLNWKFE